MEYKVKNDQEDRIDLKLNPIKRRKYKFKNLEFLALNTL